MRSEISLLFSDPQRCQLRINLSRQGSEFRSRFHSYPENARRIWRGEESVPAEHNLRASTSRSGKRFFYSINGALRLLADEFQRHVQRFLFRPTPVGSKVS